MAWIAHCAGSLTRGVQLYTLVNRVGRRPFAANTKHSIGSYLKYSKSQLSARLAVAGIVTASVESSMPPQEILYSMC